MTEPNSEEGQGEVWYREPTLTHELGFLVMEDNTPIAIVPRSAIADRIIADHTAALEGRKAEQRIRELEAALREIGAELDRYYTKSHPFWPIINRALLSSPTEGAEGITEEQGGNGA